MCSSVTAAVQSTDYHPQLLVTSFSDLLAELLRGALQPPVSVRMRHGSLNSLSSRLRSRDLCWWSRSG